MYGGEWKKDWHWKFGLAGTPHAKIKGEKATVSLSLHECFSVSNSYLLSFIVELHIQGDCCDIFLIKIYVMTSH